MRTQIREVLGRLTKRETLQFSALVMCRIMLGLLDVAGIVLIGLLAGVLARQDGAASPVIAGYMIPVVSARGLLWLTGAVLGVFAVKALGAVALVRAQARFVARVESRHATAIARDMLGGSLVSLKRRSRAELQYGLTASMTFAFTGVLNNIASLVVESALVLAIAATFFVVSPPIAAFSLGYFGLVVAIIQLVIVRRVKRAASEAAAGTVETTALIGDTVETFREISVLRLQGVFSDRVGAARRRVAQANASLTFLSSVPRYVIEAALILGVVILVAQQLVSNGVQTGFVTVGVFIAGGARLMGSLLPLQTAFQNLRQNSEQAELALQLMREAAVTQLRHADASAEPKDGRGSQRAGLRVRMRRVSFRYPDAGRPAVRSVSLTIAPGSIVALVGPSGSGKTTLVDLLLGLLTPDVGSVELDGRPPADASSVHPGDVAYVPQRPGVISGSILENIALGVSEENIDWDAVEFAIDGADLRETVDALPEGVRSSVGRQANSLSGGQLQRIGLARALYPRPRLLVLDEATSALDAAAEAHVTAGLEALRGSTTVVVIAHRLSTVQRADEIFVVENGRLTASGRFAEVTRKVPLLADYVRYLSFDPDLSEAGEDSA